MTSTRETSGENQKSVFQDKLFRRITIASTGLAFAAGFGTLAALDLSSNHGLQLRWHWSVIPCMIFGILGNWRLWSVFLAAEGGIGALDKKKFTLYCVLLIAIGIAVFLYPIRFVDKSRWSEIAQGLIAAAGILGLLAYVIYRLGRGFVEADSITQMDSSKSAENEVEKTS